VRSDFYAASPVPTAAFEAPAESALLAAGKTVELAVRAQPGQYDVTTVTRVCFVPVEEGYYYGSSVGCAVPGADGVARLPWKVMESSGRFLVRAQVTMSDGTTFYDAASRDVVVARPPSAPQGVVVETGGDGTATVAWTPAESFEPIPVDGYVVTVSPGGRTVTVTGTSVELTGLTNGVRHQFTVGAYNAIGTGGKVAAWATPGVVTDFGSYAMTPSLPTAGSTVTVAATLRAGTAAVPGVTVALRACRYTGSTCTTTRATTSATGRVTFAYVPRENTGIEMLFAGAGPYLPSELGETLRAKAKVTGTLSATRVAAGTTVTMRGTVSPVRYKGFVYLQRYSGGVWRNATYRTQSSTGTVAVPLTMPRGTYTYRLYVGRTYNAEPGWSPARTLTVY
jgi:hypothetical protein